MDIYIYVVIITLLIQYIPVKSEKAHIIKIIVSFIPIFLFGALRINFGLDYEGYESDYYTYHSLSDWFNAIEHDEKGYVVFARLMPTWRALVVVQSLLVCMAYAFVFYKYVPRKYLCVAFILLFLAGDKTIFFMFSGIRNSIAISIMLFSVPLILKRRLIPFIGTTLLAMSFHTSAVLVMPILYIICGRRIVTKGELWLWGVAILFLAFTPLDNIASEILPFMNNNFDRYDTYMETAKEIGDNRSLAVYVSSLLMSAFLLISAYESKVFEDSISIKKLAIIFPCSDLLGAMNGRLYLYVVILLIIGLVNLLKDEKKPMIKWGATSIIIFYLAYSFFNVFLSTNAIIYSHYQSILF